MADSKLFLKASNGGAAAPGAVIKATRPIGSTTLITDVLTNMPYRFMAVTGSQLPSGVIDPTTKTAMQCQLTVTTSAATNPATVTNDTTVGTVAWVNPGNVATNADATFTSNFSGTRLSDYLKAVGYGFTIPTGSSILGIKLSINRKLSNAINAVAHDNSVRLLKAGVLTGDDKADTATNYTLPNTYAVANYGGLGDLWGADWQPADINSTTFGSMFSASLFTTGSTRVVSVNTMQITVYYALASSGITITDFLEGSADEGNIENQVINILPTTHWANTVSGVLNSAMMSNPALSFDSSATTIAATNVVGDSFNLSATVFENGRVTSTYRYTLTGTDFSNGYALVNISHNFNGIPKVRARWNSLSYAGSSWFPLPFMFVSNVSYSGKPVSCIVSVQSVDSLFIHLGIAMMDGDGSSIMAANYDMAFQFYLEAFGTTI